ncbi:sodium:solute symporter [Paludisphaera sp.]|uniref:sodium:solute symporter n=1 Tax=Paludisphaera sp. TaxID=2017432 RepID=UPI00301D8798
MLIAQAHSASTLTGLDWLVVGTYFGLLLAVALWVIRKGKETADDYFLAGRNLSWWVVGASIFASNVGSEHVVGLAGSGAADGVAMAHYELHAWCVLVLAWVFVPFYSRSMVFTMPEFLERRFSPASRYVLSVVSIVMFIVSKIAVGVFAGGVVFATLLPEVSLDLGGVVIDSFWLGSILVILLTGLYTVLGGMRAVAYNDAVQTVVLILGSAALTIYGLYTLGGWGELRRLCGSDMFNLWRPLIPAGVEGTWAPVLETDAAGRVVRQAWYFNGDYPWLGMLFCAPIIGLWYWCTDQYIVQRTLGAPDQRTARRGSIFAGFLKLLPVYLFLVPGMIGFALAKSGKVPGLEAMVTADGQPVPREAQAVFPLLVKHLLPTGLRGLVVAGLLSALMSSLAGVFNACSTLFTVDLYQKWRPQASQARVVRVGQIATAGTVVIALAWLPVIQGARGLYNYLQAVQGYLAPPIFVVFFMGVTFKRLNGRGCFWAMTIGFLMGAFRMLVDTPVTLGLKGYENGYAPGSFLWIVNNIYFQYFSVLIAIVSATVLVVVSYLTPAPDYERIRGLTFATATDEDRARTRASWDWTDVVASAVVLAGILFAYVYFRG